ncbi:MAG: archaeosortase/exosortase family protein [Candidatus Bathyarchaeota archaeon]|nr:archaeosortase/exosortase family protein [Candidatus Bathyarchaeota archaeon]
MQIKIQEIRKTKDSFLKTAPLIAFTFAILWLYLLYPMSFELMWKGRTFQLFFIWLIFVEVLLNWESIQTIRETTLFSIKSLTYILVLILPATYVVVSNYFGLNVFITSFSKQMNIQWWDSMALSIEYLIFTFLSGLIIYLSFGKNGLKKFSIPIVFLGIVGTLYAIDNIFPYGEFTPFQLIVPTTAMIATQILSLLGYDTTLTTMGNMPRLTAIDPNNPLRSATFDIAWPCAGIESLLIYSVIILLFLKRLPISWKRKTIYYMIGALITYLINILRIVTIFTIGMEQGDFQLFHFYYGPLYSISWIIFYPLIILAIQRSLKKIKSKTIK